MNNRFTGIRGEQSALKYLEKSGYKIIARNVLYVGGEIDIVALDGEAIVFIEVKSRESSKFGSPLEAVTPAKVNNIISASRKFIAENRLYGRDVRFDVISVLRGNIEHIKDAFWSN